MKKYRPKRVRPVSYFTQTTPVKGNAHYTATWEGAIYHFTSAENKAVFEQNLRSMHHNTVAGVPMLWQKIKQ